MKHIVFLLAIAFLFTACGSDKQSDEQKQADEQQAAPHEHETATSDLPSSGEWVRPIPVTGVSQYDLDGNGLVYNDNMCWNVISDVEGKCPQCGMRMTKVSVADAESNLKKHGMME